MKHLLYQLTAIYLVMSFFSCNTKQTTETTVESPVRSYSESYKAPVFEPDDRIAKIKQVAPELQKSIEEHAKAEHLPGVAFGIVVDNELVFSSATGYLNLEKEIPASPLSAFRIASMTKSFTAMAIIKLRDEGKLSLNDPVSKYVPEMSKLTYLTKDAPTIDIENLLTMTAGFPEDKLTAITFQRWCPLENATVFLSQRLLRSSGGQC